MKRCVPLVVLSTQRFLASALNKIQNVLLRNHLPNDDVKTCLHVEASDTKDAVHDAAHFAAAFGIAVCLALGDAMHVTLDVAVRVTLDIPATLTVYFAILLAHGAQQFVLPSRACSRDLEGCLVVSILHS
jgi:hypothetical protein